MTTGTVAITIRGAFGSVQELPFSVNIGDAYIVNGDMFVYTPEGWIGTGSLGDCFRFATLGYRGKILQLWLPTELVEIIEDPDCVTEDEMRLIEMTWKEYHQAIINAWRKESYE